LEEDTSLSVGAAWIAGQDRSMWRTLRPSAGQAQQWVSEWVKEYYFSIGAYSDKRYAVYYYRYAVQYIKYRQLFVRNRVFCLPHLHSTPSPGDAPAIITQYLAWMEWQFNACQTPRSMYLSIFNSFRVIRCISQCVSPKIAIFTQIFVSPGPGQWR